jgi:aminoglycoside phosphotransferase (APT) family kinase protein
MGGSLSSAQLQRDQEFKILRAVYEAGVPAPRPFYFFPVGELEGGRAAFLMKRLDGETIGRRIVQDPALGEARKRLPEQIAQALAAIHSVNIDDASLAFLHRPVPGQTAAQAVLDELEVDLRAIDEPHPALELALRWLRAHDPGPGDLVLVHGDFRVGNFMIGPDGLHGVLDWELVHVGDPHEDLGWMSVRAWRFGKNTLPAGGLSSRQAFYTAYSHASGRQVDPQRVFYWEVVGNLRWALIALGQAGRHLSGQESSVELASLGRVACEMELELLHLIGEDEEKKGGKA